MSAIFGWLGRAPAESRSARLSAMAERSGPSGSASLRVVSESEATLAATGGDRSLLVDDGHSVTVACGLPPGHDEALDRAPSDLASLAQAGGGFALASFERESRALRLAVDPYGIEELYYLPTAEGAVFASTARGIRAHPDAALEIDPQAVFDYLYFHVVPRPRSVFKGLRRVLPGTTVTISGGTVREARYWIPAYDVGEGAEEAELARTFHHEMREAVRGAMAQSAAPTGAFLSGGTDSSTVSGHLAELSEGAAPTFSIGFDVPGYDETRYARLAAEHFKTQHHEYVVSPEDVTALAPRLAAGFDEPFGNASAIASYYCARLARESGMSSLLAGDGGDEIFAGNARYDKQRVFEYYQSIPEALRLWLIEPLALRLPANGSGALRVASKVKSYVSQAKVKLPERLESYNFVRRMTPDAIFPSSFLSEVRSDEPIDLLRGTYDEAPTRSVLNRLLYLDLKFTLADNDLRKVSGTCALAGVEVRYPFLAPELVDFANRLPPRLKLRPGKLRYFFKRASAGFLPEEVLTKSKHGFGVPCGRWMLEHRPLGELVQDNLPGLVKRGYVRSDFLERLRALHREHPDYYGVMLWTLTMLELWHQHHAP